MHFKKFYAFNNNCPGGKPTKNKEQFHNTPWERPWVPYKIDLELWEAQETLWTHPLHASGLPTVFRHSPLYLEQVPPLSGSSSRAVPLNLALTQMTIWFLGLPSPMDFILLTFPSFSSSPPGQSWLIQPDGGIQTFLSEVCRKWMPKSRLQGTWATCTTPQGEARNHMATSEHPSLVITPSLLHHNYFHTANYFPLEWGTTGTWSCPLFIPSPAPGSMAGRHSKNSLGKLRKSHVLSLNPPSVVSFKFWRHVHSANRKGVASSALPSPEQLSTQKAWTSPDKIHSSDFWPLRVRCRMPFSCLVGKSHFLSPEFFNKLWTTLTCRPQAIFLL